MGIGDPIMPLILSTPSDKLHWLSRDELQITGLATDWVDGEHLLSKAVSTAQPPTEPALRADTPAASTIENPALAVPPK